MNKVLLSLSLAAFILTGTSYAQPTPASAPAVAAPTEAIKPSHHERHPELVKARHKLRGAKADLEKAAHDYDGHKAKAIEAIDHAIEEITAAIESDKK